KTLLVLDARSRTRLSTQTFRRDLVGPYAVNIVGEDAYIAGLWNPEPARGLPTLPGDTFFESLWIGERVSVASGAVEGALRPYETRCTAGAACIYADVDRIRGSGPARWVASLGISTRVAIYDEQRQRIGLHDISSPRFLRDGTELPVSASAEAAERWKSRNSIIRRVFSIGGYLVTIHTLTEIGPDWQFGQMSRFQVFMNIHSVDGRGLVSDVRLPDIPIGRDETHLYVVDY